MAVAHENEIRRQAHTFSHVLECSKILIQYGLAYCPRLSCAKIQKVQYYITYGIVVFAHPFHFSRVRIQQIPVTPSARQLGLHTRP